MSQVTTRYDPAVRCATCGHLPSEHHVARQEIRHCKAPFCRCFKYTIKETQ